jgi:tetratricopeptide (TPR) repeat protein
MGEVYLAEDVRLGRHVAVKVLPAAVGADPAAVERFEREARVVSSLNHPNICTLHDVGVHQERRFMVMELLEGETLQQRIARGPLPIDDVLTFGAEAAAGLDAAHRRGVVHRDIKPANLFLTSSGPLKVLDFGVAKPGDMAGAADRTVAGAEPLTSLGMAIGTVAYMSPEQARGQAIDARSDLFSLGIVLYEMATGASPFPGTTPATIFEGILTKTPAPPSTLRTGLPGDLDRVIARALEKDPAHRYQSAADLRAELKRLLRDTGQLPTAVMTAPAAAAAAPRRPRWWWLAAPLGTAAVVAGVIAWQSESTPALQSRDPVLLASLDNRTGDTMFDDTLGEALAVQLRQSPFLNLVPDQRVQATLRMMQQPPGTPVIGEIGRDVCQRVGARALLTSTIAGLGSSYVITLSARDCVTGDVLAEHQVQASTKEAVLTELGGAASHFREQLGESLASIKRYDARIEAATTPSLEALKAYSQALATRRTQGDRAALPLLRRAVELDPEFALAHARLGTVYSNLLDDEASRRHTERAFELRDEVSEVERLYIEARYYTIVKPDLNKAIDAYRVSIATYPNDYASRTNLALLLKERGELEEALAMMRAATELAPEEPSARINLASGLIALGRYDEAKKELARLISVVDNGQGRSLLLQVAVLTGDAALEQEQLTWAQSNGDPTAILPARLVAAIYRGQLREAERLAIELQRAFTAAGTPNAAAAYYAYTATGMALLGATDRARVLIASAPGDGSGDQTADERLFQAALSGDAATAKRMLPAALEDARRDSAAKTVALRAVEQTARGDYAGALATIGEVQLNQRDGEMVLVQTLVAEKLERWDLVIRNLEWFIPNGRREVSATLPKARALLGLAYEGAGRRAEARKALEDFVAWWSTADPDVPLLVEVKQALTRLAGT